MERHLDTLLGRIRRYRAGEISADDVYVWWGKVRSPHREGALPHLETICALETDVDSREVHVYLTDYRSLFVAHLGEVTCDDIRELDDEPMPDYYKEFGDCDCWFRLWDIRRIVVDDTAEVVNQLKKLRGPPYHNRPVSIYGGMRDLPLIVTREDDVAFFDPDRRKHLTENKFWAEFDAEHAGIGAIELCKAYEVQTNEILQALARRIPEDSRFVNFDGRTRSITELGHLTLGELARVLRDPDVADPMRHWMNRDDANWFLGSLPAILVEVSDTRNAAAHSKRVDREAALRIRERALGVGCEGHLARLGKVRIN
ncbi:MAG: hypothetical protein ABIV11_02895 [Gemmatimonadaceae bacterium]